MHAVLVCLGIAGAAVALVDAIAIRDFGVSVDIDHLYGAAYTDRES